MPAIFKYLLAPFLTVTRRGIIEWAIVAVLIATLDEIGMVSVDDVESHRHNTFGIFGDMSYFLVTIPMVLAKAAISYPVFYFSGVDLLKLAFRGDFVSFGFDLFVCFLFFIAFRIARHIGMMLQSKSTFPSSSSSTSQP